MNALADEIETYLLKASGWVSASVLAVEFQVDEREFRSTDGKPGLLSGFAISGNQGFRHVKLCTAEEWDRFYWRIRRHGIGELVRVRRLRDARRNETRKVPPLVFEKHSDQAVMFA